MTGCELLTPPGVLSPQVSVWRVHRQLSQSEPWQVVNSWPHLVCSLHRYRFDEYTANLANQSHDRLWTLDPPGVLSPQVSVWRVHRHLSQSEPWQVVNSWPHLVCSLHRYRFDEYTATLANQSHDRLWTLDPPGVLSPQVSVWWVHRQLSQSEPWQVVNSWPPWCALSTGIGLTSTPPT